MTDDTIAFRAAWQLDSAVVPLNHGSYGACPSAVLEHQSEIRRELERSPDAFFGAEFERLRLAARDALAEFVGANGSDIAFMPNATTGVNTVLANLRLLPGDEILTTDHAYAACRNAASVAARRAGAVLISAPIRIPLRSEGEVIEQLFRAATPRTKLLLIDHISSPTAIVFPIAEIIAEFRRRGIEVLVDGAHAPGQIALDLRALAPDYYAGNCHKWMCAPKGAAFLYVAPQRQEHFLPLVTSHGETAACGAHSRFQMRFRWSGTDDPSARFSAGRAISFIEELVPGGWAAAMSRNQRLACEAGAALAARLGSELICPARMLGAMAAMPLPAGLGRFIDGLRGADAAEEPRRRFWRYLYERHGIDALVTALPGDPRYFLRISAALYNTAADFARLGDVLISLA